MDQNQYNQQPQYQQTYYAAPPVQAAKSNTCATVSLVIAIISFFINTLYLPSIAAIILGVIGISNAKKCAGKGKGSAVWGIILGICSLILGFIIDIILSILTFGLGAVSFLI